MTAPAHVSSILDSMLKPCPYCNAQAMQPCKTPGTRHPLRFTHAERNR